MTPHESALSQKSPFSVRNLKFQSQNGSNGDPSGHNSPLSGDPEQSSDRPFIWTFQKTSEKIRGGSNERIYRSTPFVGSIEKK